MTEQIENNVREFVALVVNDEAMTLADVLRAAQFRGHLGFLQRIADAALIRQAAAQQGIEATDEELQAAADQFRTHHELHKATELLAWLEQRHLSLTAWETGLEEDLLAEKLRARLTEGKVEMYFAQNRLSYDTATISRLVVAQESLAKELRSQMVEEDADFYALARAHSLDAASRPAGGYVGVVRRTDFTSTLEAAVFGATIGAVVGPFKTDAGWELVKVEARQTAQLDDATRAQVAATLFDEWLTESRHKARIQRPLLALLHDEEDEEE
ncbi:MAG: peptidylprolyl isomerase [Blastocatellia bacterium]